LKEVRARNYVPGQAWTANGPRELFLQKAGDFSIAQNVAKA